MFARRRPNRTEQMMALMSEVHGEQEQAARRLYQAQRRERLVTWAAGSVAPCDSRSSQPHAHAVAAFHVIARCSCGAAYMSTDASLAFGMAQDHAAHLAGTEDSVE